MSTSPMSLKRPREEAKSEEIILTLLNVKLLTKIISVAKAEEDIEIKFCASGQVQIYAALQSNIALYHVNIVPMQYKTAIIFFSRTLSDSGLEIVLKLNTSSLIRILTNIGALNAKKIIMKVTDTLLELTAYSTDKKMLAQVGIKVLDGDGTMVVNDELEYGGTTVIDAKKFIPLMASDADVSMTLEPPQKRLKVESEDDFATSKNFLYLAKPPVLDFSLSFGKVVIGLFKAVLTVFASIDSSTLKDEDEEGKVVQETTISFHPELPLMVSKTFFGVTVKLYIAPKNDEEEE